MRIFWTLLACVGIGLGVLRADDLPLEIFVSVRGDKDVSKVDEGAEYGKGQETEKSIGFTLKITNNAIDPLAKMTFKLYAIGGQNWVDKTLTRKKLVVHKVLQKDLDPLPAGASEVDLGEVVFKSTITHQGNMTWFGGLIYDGYVLEIDQDGKVAEVRSGNPSWRKVYDDYLKNGGGSKEE